MPRFFAKSKPFFSIESMRHVLEVCEANYGHDETLFGLPATEDGVWLRSTEDGV